MYYEIIQWSKDASLKHYVTPHLEHYKPDIAVIRMGSNNMSYNNLDIDTSILGENVIKIKKKCIDYGVEEVVISSVFVKESIRIIVPLLEKLMMNYQQQIKF